MDEVAPPGWEGIGGLAARLNEVRRERDRLRERVEHLEELLWEAVSDDSHPDEVGDTCGTASGSTSAGTARTYCDETHPETGRTCNKGGGHDGPHKSTYPGGRDKWTTADPVAERKEEDDGF